MSTAKHPTGKTSARNASSRRKAAPKPTPAMEEGAGESAASEMAGEFADALRKKELIDRIVARTGAKKSAAKPVVEAVLAELGETLAAGRSLVLPPLGRLKVTREKAQPNGRVMVVRMRQSTPPLKAVLQPPKTPSDR